MFFRGTYLALGPTDFPPLSPILFQLSEHLRTHQRLLVGCFLAHNGPGLVAEDHYCWPGGTYFVDGHMAVTDLSRDLPINY